MKNFSLFSMLALFCLNFSFKPQSIDNIVKSKMARISAAYFCDKYEISNNDWRKYRQNVGEKEGFFSEKYLKTAQDTAVWHSNDIKYPDPSVDYYHQHPAFGNYPVVGVSYEQAQSYALWRTEKTNEALAKAGINELITFRLPKKQEWEDLAAKEINAHFVHKYQKQKAKNIEVANFWTVINSNSYFYMITAPVDAFFPNSFGLYNMRGNVAEMVQEKGLAKGGSWLDREIESPVTKDFESDKPKCWLGFRLAMIVSGKMCGVK
jgi:sulfatase modifying factor 1